MTLKLNRKGIPYGDRAVDLSEDAIDPALIRGRSPTYKLSMLKDKSRSLETDVHNSRQNTTSKKAVTHATSGVPSEYGRTPSMHQNS